MNTPPDSSISRKASLMRRRPPKQVIALALAAGAAVAIFAPRTDAQLAPVGPRPTATQPATAPTTQQGATSRPTTNNVHGIPTQPGGGLMLNFKEASIDSVLDELSAAAGFIVMKQVPKLEGRVTLVSKQPVTPDEAVPLLNSVLKNAGYAAIQQGRVLKINSIDKTKRANTPVRTRSDPAKIDDNDQL